MRWSNRNVKWYLILCFNPYILVVIYVLNFSDLVALNNSIRQDEDLPMYWSPIGLGTRYSYIDLVF